MASGSPDAGRPPVVPPAVLAEAEQALAEAGLTGNEETFFRAVRHARGRAARAADGALTLPQYHLLEPLAAEGALPVGVLADEAGVAAPTATKMLDGLVRAGLVERTSAPHDRRVVLISLTGGVVGTLVGVGMSLGIERLADIRTSVSAVSVALACGVSITVGLVFGIMPAWRAAEQDPLVSLRHE